MLENTLESPLDYKESQPVHPKGNQSWICIGRTDAEAETPKPWPPDAKNWLTGKETLMLGKIEVRRRRGQQRMRWLDGITDSVDSCWWWTGRPGMLQSMGLERVGHWATELNWTELIRVYAGGVPCNPLAGIVLGDLKVYLGQWLTRWNLKNELKL